MKEPLVLACECGATLKASDLDGVTILRAEQLWRDLHGTHTAVSCAEAREIRQAEWERRKRLSDEWRSSG